MNQRSWAITVAVFIAGIMIFSTFAGFVMRDGGPVETVSRGAWNPSDFGVGGRLISWDFDGVGDALGMYPQDLVFAFWIDMTASEDLNEAAALSLPLTVGLTYRDQVNLYPEPIDRLSWGLFRDEIVEFHWTKPARIGVESLAILYNGYQMIPLGTTDIFTVMGTPVLFGGEPSVRTILDVLAGQAPTTDEFVLPYDEVDALQISSLGKDVVDNPGFVPPLGGVYLESYLGVSPYEGGYYLTAKYLSLRGESERRVFDLARDYALEISSADGITAVSGSVETQNLAETLGAFVAP
ncbi:hypothetical protein P0O24_03555 [Methanotrichaceae archaeon M04Ac]|uniref:Uncharacterized protein n=1 Tax=Candidatus Methanocrinis alkalitolerans TaxID=3033395 RepID=A0ABT5XD55_9EURY|nr:hypothetical protein [Candidatus Methanocrinis alkalitolerans]MCR3883322.1 hypothetical protein [Methanothrix sp.]MDF0592655.1 hypothetical protein [Candidatus Methanocrinis alkalitolerans]